MPRPREFRPDDLLDGALTLFWEKGYEATSIRDIVERTGVNQFGIYQLYGDKQGLFLAVLDRYRDTIVEGVFGIVERPDASLAEIRAYFGQLVHHHSVTMPAMGCLMASSMAEHAADNAGIRERVGGHFERLRSGFIRALETARSRGEVRADLDIPTTAEYLAVSVQGLAVYSRLNSDAATLQRYVDTTLSLVMPPTPGEQKVEHFSSPREEKGGIPTVEDATPPGSV
jgi:TetR/AcrR family transcriptional repressor of nem operon